MQTKVLLIGENPQGYSRLVKCLEGRGCKCSFATTYQEAVPLLGLQDFDLVLSPMRVRDGSVFPLISLLESSRTTLFYFQQWKQVAGGCPLFGSVETALDHMLFVRASSLLRLTLLWRRYKRVHHL